MPARMQTFARAVVFGRATSTINVGSLNEWLTSIRPVKIWSRAGFESAGRSRRMGENPAACLASAGLDAAPFHHVELCLRRTVSAGRRQTERPDAEGVVLRHVPAFQIQHRQPIH